MAHHVHLVKTMPQFGRQILEIGQNNLIWIIWIKQMKFGWSILNNFLTNGPIHVNG